MLNCDFPASVNNVPPTEGFMCTCIYLENPFFSDKANSLCESPQTPAKDGGKVRILEWYAIKYLPHS